MLCLIFCFQFKRATVQNYKSGNLETAAYRISKTAWLRREEDELIENIYRRAADLTGLSMETSEELQVSNYGIGGHYEPHFDFARVKNSILHKEFRNTHRSYKSYEANITYNLLSNTSLERRSECI